MIDLKKIEAIASEILARLPAGSDNLQQALQANIRLVLSDAFAQMDLVTREEFDAQTALLQRTRQKLQDLERELEALKTDPE